MYLSKGFLAALAAATTIPLTVLAELTRLNTTSIEALESSMANFHNTKVARRDDGWCAIFYSERNCGGILTDAFCGHGPVGCQVLNSPFSTQWLPSSSGLSIKISSNDHCSNGCCSNSFGPGEGGCRGFTQNVGRTGVQSFLVY